LDDKELELLGLDEIEF